MHTQAAHRLARATGRAREHGVALIEMALALPILLVVAFVGVDISRGFLTVNRLAQESREASRRLIAGEDTLAVRSTIEANMATLGLGSPHISFEWIDDCTHTPCLHLVRATARCQFGWLFPALPGLGGVPGNALSAGTTMMLVAPPSHS
jgi:Tfp pilus assembly protein PilX